MSHSLSNASKTTMLPLLGFLLLPPSSSPDNMLVLCSFMSLCLLFSGCSEMKYMMLAEPTYSWLVLTGGKCRTMTNGKQLHKSR